MTVRELAGVPIYKMTGSGNDFVFVDGRVRPGAAWTAEEIRAVCARRVGVGADGLVVLEPGSAAGRVRFHFFNADGGRGAMCGNAALCATRLSAQLALAPPAGMVLETDAGEVRTRCLDEADRAELTLPAVLRVDEPHIPLEAGETAIGFAAVGVEHVVVLREGPVDGIDIATRGPALRHHPVLGRAGANANFVGQDPDGGWAMRTWERGVEGETLACGTGAVACALVLAARGLVTLPWTVRTRSGAPLTVSATLTPAGPAIAADPRLAGEGRLVYQATLGSVAR